MQLSNNTCITQYLIVSYVFVCLYIGESPLIWKDLTEGNHTVIVRGLCLSNGSPMTRRRKFKFQIR